MSGYIGTAPVPQAVQRRQSFTATAGQTSFATVSYTVGFVDVFLNGVHLLGDGTDYTASNGSDIVLTAGASAGDVVEVISFETFEVANQTFTGTTTVTKSSGAPLVANRQVDDGSIIDLRKNGSTAGIIGSNTSGSRLHIGKDNVALSFAAGGANAIIPWDSTANAVEDAALSLGGSTARFKDLYLSGGVYLGGTGSANKLDDYEEGSWTPAIAGLSMLAEFGSYTKVGDVVTAQFQINSTGTSNIAAAISGLPFSVKGGSNVGRAAGYLGYNPSGTNYTLLFTSGINQAAFRITPTGATVTGSAISGNVFWGTLIYKTT